ncbi:hypothetical protein ARAM_006804 [Aspergillus rambellii]|uniref:Uncharacterized protein n=1 Tax=Aspergillus rambellii TaxID=308745 RepID=A0A0F8UGE2_9EURO|nr:hypothetical protein ARAM_006804 [Aspergillus rambellii]
MVEEFLFGLPGLGNLKRQDGYILQAAGNPERLVNCTDRKFNVSALSWAAIHGHELVVDLLLSIEGIDPNPRNPRRRTPLSHAAENGHATVVARLLAHEGVDADARDSVYRTPLLWTVSQLVSNLSEPDTDSVGRDFRLPWSVARMSARGIQYHRGRDPVENYKAKIKLYQAVWESESTYLRIVNLLLAHGVDLEAADASRQTAIAYAAKGGSRRLVELLLDHGAGVNSGVTYPKAPSSVAGVALYGAAGSGDMDTVKLLLERGAIMQDGSWSALNPAAQNGHASIVEVLLQSPVPKSPIVPGRTSTWQPLLEAIQRGHLRVVHTLLLYRKHSYPAMPLFEDALFWAACGGWEFVFRMLLGARSPLSGNCPYLEGIPVLAAGVMGRNMGILQRLLEIKGIDVNAEDRHGWTALTWAAGIENQEAEALLLEHGADPSYKKEITDPSQWRPPHGMFLQGQTVRLPMNRPYPLSFSSRGITVHE